MLFTLNSQALYWIHLLGRITVCNWLKSGEIIARYLCTICNFEIINKLFYDFINHFNSISNHFFVCLQTVCYWEERFSCRHSFITITHCKWDKKILFCFVYFDPVSNILLNPTVPQLMALLITFSKDRLQVRFDFTSVV